MTRDLLLPDACAPHVAAAIQAQLDLHAAAPRPTLAQQAADRARGPVTLRLDVTDRHGTRVHEALPWPPFPDPDGAADGDGDDDDAVERFAEQLCAELGTHFLCM